MKEGKMLKVLISCEKLPKATAQQKGVSIARNGKPHFYEKKKVTSARKFFADAGAWRDDALIVELRAAKSIAQSTPAHPVNEMLLLIIREIA